MHGFKLLMERINEQGKGEITIDYLGGPEVFKRAERIEAVRKGVIDIAILPASAYKAEIPEGSAIPLGGYMTWAQERERGIFDYFRQLHEERLGVYLVGGSNKGGSFIFGLDRWVDKPADLAGLKLRTGSLFVPFFAALDVATVSMKPADVYTAMDRGVIDGYAYIAPMAVSLGFHEVTKYWLNHLIYGGGSVQILMNLDSWNKLPQKTKDLFEVIQKEVEPEVEGWWALQHTQAFEEFKAAGMEPIEFSSADAKWFLDLSIESLWGEVEKKVSSESYAKLRELYEK